MSENTIGLIALVGAAGALAQWTAWRINLPSILLLLFAGIFLGPVLGWVNPDELLGDLLFPFVSISVAIILFEGGLTLDRREIRGHGAVVNNLITIGAAITGVGLAVSVHYLFGFEWPMAFLFGAIGLVTGPTVIKPLLKTVRPKEKIGQVLHWEGILIDPLGALLAIVVFEYMLNAGTGMQTQEVTIVLLKLVIIGLVVGICVGQFLAVLLREHIVPDFLKETITLFTLVLAFAVSEYLQHESGLLTVTVMGIWLANAKGVRIKEILHFNENLTILLISGLFILLAARLDLSSLLELGPIVLVFLFIVQFVVRPLSAWICTIGSGWQWQERVVLGWIAPRGIVAAAISSLFLLRLESVDINGKEALVPLAFALIIGTVVFQSLTAKPVASWLGVSNPAPNGVLIVGANSVAITIGKALHDCNVQVQMIDRNHRQVQAARKSRLPTYYGHPTSAYAEQHLPLSGLGTLLSLSRNQDLNALAAIHFRTSFGSENVYLLSEKSGSSELPEDRSSELKAFKHPFSNGITYEDLESALNAGAQIDVMDIETDIDDFKAYLREIVTDKTGTESGETESVPLFLIGENGSVSVFCDADEPDVKEGSKVLVLLYP